MLRALRHIAGQEMDVDHPAACTAPTVFNALNTTRTTWGIYCQTDIAGIPYVSGLLSYSEMLHGCAFRPR